MAGEPRYLTDKEIKQVETMSGLGLPTHYIASIIGISKKSFERRLKDQPELYDAVLKGRAEVSQKLRQTAYDLAIHERNPTMIIFLLKTREGFKEDMEDMQEDLKVTKQNVAELYKIARANAGTK